ncbi:MAG: class I SAM-dependent methyltransferase, partial [Bacteriovoracaceae bacterium]|nr:class I SAM-dependent methyltransferase [Bacteriovoracaceae bacterium]
AKRLGVKIRDEAFQLLREDSQNIVDGFYPKKVLKPESPLTHMLRFLKIAKDMREVYARRVSKKIKITDDKFKDYPNYFKQNFHFQTGGYLSSESAELYNHQVEILFTGMADAMRRSFLKPLKKMSTEPHPHFLEIAAGTGITSRFVKMAFPESTITVSELSETYLAQAKKDLKKFNDISFCRADATELPFADASFDATYQVFLLHELPLKERIETLKEQWRVTKDNGFMIIVESLQLDDKKELNEVLFDFPKKYHEPYFKNYTENALEEILSGLSGTLVHKDLPFLSKCLIFQKKAL